MLSKTWLELKTLKRVLIMATIVLMGAQLAHGQLAPHAAALSAEFSRVIDKVGPSVVSITTIRVIESRGGGLLREFFGGQLPEGFRVPGPQGELKQRGLGSGVIVSDQGYILTNNHVVADATQLTVTLSDGRQLDATVVGTDPPTDLAVLKLDGNDFPTADLGNSDDLKVGSLILAVGSPFGLDRTVTSGIISATGRANVGISQYEDFIQTDAAINPGNSGGPLVNMNGEVIGISTAILSRTGGSMGVGFAVPINMAESVMKAIIEDGRVTRGWLGVSIQDLTPQLAEALDIDRTDGALIADVLDDTPAAQAGIKRGDIIVELNDKPVESSTDLRNRVAQIKPGNEVNLLVLRDGSDVEVSVTVGERPSQQGMGQQQERGAAALGLDVRPLTDELRQRFNIEENQGVIVANVDPGSDAYAQGIRPGMVIQEVNRREVNSPDEFNRLVNQAQQKGKVLLLVSFRGQSSYILINLEQDNK